MQFFASSSSGAEPIAWWKNRPVYLAFVLVGVNLAAIVATALLQAVKAFGVLSLLGLNYPYAMHGEIWRFLTFPFVQPLGAGNMAGPFWTLISLLMLGRFGFLIEQSIGWGRLLRLYLLLVLTPIVPIVLLGGKIPAYFGTTDANFGLFVAFAVLAPDAPMFLIGTAKWWAIGWLAFIGLFGMANHDWFAVIPLACAGSAYAYLRTLSSGDEPGWLERWKLRRTEAKWAKQAARAEKRKRQDSGQHYMSEQVDPILDKITQHGMKSLTEEERRILERAKEKLK